MAETLTTIDVTSDTFLTWVTQTNAVIDTLSLRVMTANSSDANGSVTTGNALLQGIFAAQTGAFSTGIRGGNVQSSANLTIHSNINTNNSFSWYLGNTTVNNQINSLSFTIGNSTVTTSIDKDEIYVGNSTINVSMSTSQVYIGNTTVNSISNSSLLRLANSTVTFTVAKPTATQVTDADYYLASDSTWKQISGTGAPTTTVTLSGTSAQEIHSFLKADYFGYEYAVVLKDLVANNVSMHEWNVMHDEGDAYYTEFSVISSNTGNTGVFTANANSTHIRAYFTPVSSSANIAFAATGIAKQ